MTMDGSSIIDRLRYDNVFLNGGWCYGGFKTIPASGAACATLVATGTPPDLIKAYTLCRVSRPATCSTNAAAARSRCGCDAPQSARSAARASCEEFVFHKTLAEPGGERLRARSTSASTGSSSASSTGSTWAAAARGCWYAAIPRPARCSRCGCWRARRMSAGPMSTPRRGLWLGEERFGSRFDGRAYAAQRGDTAASALLAARRARDGPQRQVPPPARACQRRPRGAERAAHGRRRAGRDSERAGAAAASCGPGSCCAARTAGRRCATTSHRCCSSAAASSAPASTTRPSSGPRGTPRKGMIRRLAGQGAGARRRATLGARRRRSTSAATCSSPAAAPRASPPRSPPRGPARASSLCEREPVCGGELDFEAASDRRPAAQAWVAATLARTRRARCAGADRHRRASGARTASLYALAAAGRPRRATTPSTGSGRARSSSRWARSSVRSHSSTTTSRA